MIQENQYNPPHRIIETLLYQERTYLVSRAAHLVGGHAEVGNYVRTRCDETVAVCDEDFVTSIIV